MSEDLTYRLFGQDVSASRAMHGVGDAADKTGNKVEGFGSKAGGALGKVGAIAGTAIAGAAVGAVVGLGAAMVGGIQSAISYETLGKKTAAVIESTGNAAGISVEYVQGLAASLESMSGVDEELIINGQNVLATFTAVQDKAGEGNDIFTQATETALDMSVALGSDLQGANIQLGKALNDPIKGIGALSKVGVSFTQQQKDQIKTLVKSGDTLGAQKVILAELNKEFGGAARAAGEGLEGSLARLQDTGSDLARTIGQKLLPGLTDGIESFLTWNENTAALDKGLDALGTGFNAVWGVIKTGINWWRTYLEPAFRKVAEELLPKLRAMFSSVGRTMDEHQDIVRAVKAAFTILGSFLGTILIPLLGKIVGVLISTVGPAFRMWASLVSTVVLPALRFLTQFWLQMVGDILHGAATAFGWVPGLGPKLKGASAAFDKFAAQTTAALNSIPDQTVTIFVRTAGQVDLLKQSAQYKNNTKLQLLEKRARGGPTSANRAYLIGEEGPEIFVPSGNGHVIPNDKMLGAARTGAAVVSGQRGGDTYNITVNGYVGNESQLVKVIRQAGFSVKGRGLGYGLT